MSIIEEDSNRSRLAALARAQDLALLFTQSFPAIFVSLITAAILTTILWPARNHGVLIAWLAILSLTALGRLALFLLYRRASPGAEDILAWERPYLLTLLLATLTWGIGSVVIMPAHSPVHQVVVLSFLVGMSGGAISLYSAHRLMTLAAITTVLLPIVVWLFIQGDLLSMELAVATSVFFLSAVRATGTITESRHHNFMLSTELQRSQDRYRHLIENIGERFVIYSHKARTGEMLYVTGGIRTIFGLGKEEAIGRPWHSLAQWRPGSVDRANHQLARLIAGEVGSAQTDLEFVHPDGRERTVRASVHSVKDETGEVVAIDGIAEDITEQRSAEEKLRLAATVFDHSKDGILIADPDGNIVDANPACSEISGYSREEIIGRNPRMFSSGQHSAKFYEEMWGELKARGHWQGELWNRTKDGEVYAERISIDAVLDEQERLEHYVAVFHDISYVKEHEAELRQMAYYDVLTGLPNRLLLQDRIRLAQRQAERNQSGLAVCYLDLDGFKPINDTLGHHAGDQVLIEVSKRLQAAVRSGDTVTRVGGDEFVILLADCHDESEVREVLERVLKAVSIPLVTPAGQVSISASIGVSRAPLDTNDAAVLIQQADHAMYVAKASGRNQFRLYTPG